MNKSHRDYPTFVPATVDGEPVKRQEPTIAYRPMSRDIVPDERQRGKRRQVETIKSAAVDRARAFTIRTRSISMMTGGATAAIWFLVRWALPLTTGASTAGALVVGAVAILAGLVAFFVVWAGAYAIDMATSPGGVDLYESYRTQRRIDAQSAAMVDAYRRANGVEKNGSTK